jgi:hypothetical protein
LQETNQSRKGSAIETILNVGSGYFIAFGLNLYFLPVFLDGIQSQDIGVALIIGLVYTSVSMIRSFAFRRFFEKLVGKRKWL